MGKLGKVETKTDLKILQAVQLNEPKTVCWRSFIELVI